MVEAKSYAAGTIVNALATMKGVAFGLSLTTKVRLIEGRDLELEDPRAECVARKVLRSFGVDAGVKVTSEIPERSGLGSSSAFANALICAALKLIGKEIDAFTVLRANARISLECGTSYTGAFDDASASLLGGVVFSDNGKMKLFRREKFRGKALILLPDWERGAVDLSEIKKRSEEVERAFKLAMAGNIREAMFVNSYAYCSALKVPFEPVAVAYELGFAAGLSGNGPSYVALGDEFGDLKRVWKSFGKVIEVEVVNEPSEKVVVSDALFIRT